MLSILFPRCCLGCDRCLIRISSNDFCVRCIQALSGFQSETDIQRGHTSFFLYQGAVKAVLKRAKTKPSYRAYCGLLKLAQVRLPTLILDPFDLVVAIPSKFSSLFFRGFSPAHELSQVLTKHYKKQSVQGLQYRKGTKKQSLLNKRARIENMVEAFHAKEIVQRKRILLVDDIVTTGATILAAKRALIDAGADSVQTISLASTVLDSWFYE